ncbi:MAG: hypothetical protein U1A23_04375 [Candidatus Sungbacteria bacterium]|nr:hypothetical protein [bacterium]MDZ4286141.1 hypothetical protein [Candidatus Sungbacteria bacterium]
MILSLTSPLSRFIRRNARVLGIAAVMLPITAHASQINDILIAMQGTIDIILQIVMTLGLVAFIWGIVKLIAAAGNPQKMKEAKQIILWGIAGVAIMAMIAGIIEFIQIYLGIPGGGSITVPQFTPK